MENTIYDGNGGGVQTTDYGISVRNVCGVLTTDYGIRLLRNGFCQNSAGVEATKRTRPTYRDSSVAFEAVVSVDFLAGTDRSLG